MDKAVVFDLDHTLFDRYATLESIIESGIAYNLFKKEIDKTTLKNEWLFADKNFVHLSWDLVFDHFKTKGIVLESVGKENFFKNHILPLFMSAAVPYDFTIPTLEKIRSAGYKTGLITNGPRQLQAKKIKMLGLEPYFDGIIISGDYGVNKPNRILFDKMAELLGCEANKMFYVGDHPLNDIEGARNAGYTPIWVKTIKKWLFPEIKKCELQINTVAELPIILKI